MMCDSVSPSLFKRVRIRTIPAMSATAFLYRAQPRFCHFTQDITAPSLARKVHAIRQAQG
jgi:hypothetical protein